MISVSVGSRPRQGQRRRIISMSETIQTVRRKRLISSGSVVEGEFDQISRGSPGSFHPPLCSSREQTELQQSAIPSTSRDLPPQRLATQPPPFPITRAQTENRQQIFERISQQLEGAQMISSINFKVKSILEFS